MASRSAGTLLTQNNAVYVPPGLMPGYHGHVPNVVYSFGDTYGNATMKYLQDFRNAAMKTSCSPYSKGGQFPTLFSSDPELVIGARARGWDRWLHTPNYSRFNLDFNRSAELKEFHKLSQMHRDYYRDKTGTVHRNPYFVLPVKEKDKYPHPLDLPPLSAKTLWHLHRISPENLRTYQTFPSGKRVTSQEREVRDSYFEYRA
ncbi:protein FAM166C [Eublepharis macularius]|uniref:Ciliary microtubule inner protein 2C n=1 Tax=Eublepharis macularius TaxID=481883 RepID=A0AA97JQZ3_EUBMA|nr:protein FAM166C [Eublepharis macularius]